MLSNLKVYRIATFAVLATTLSLSVFGQSVNTDTSSNTAGGVERLLENPSGNVTGTATFPIVFCWYKGQPAPYIQTDASDPAVAIQQGVNYVSILANAINAMPAAVDDIYVVTNLSGSML
jgi:hypothetical protein